METVIDRGNRHPFLTALIFSTLVTMVAILTVTIEGRHRIEAVRREERARAAAVVQVCEEFAHRVTETFAETYDYIRQRALEAGRTPSQALVDLDEIRKRNLDPKFCLPENYINP